MAAAMLGFFTVCTAASLVPVRRAQRLVAAERDRLLDEHEAFGGFADRVECVPVGAGPDDSHTTGRSLLTGMQSGGRLQVIRDTYRESVMAVEHFETDYDESLEEHMAVELSPELAAAVVDGSQVTPALRRSLVDSARNAVCDRRVVIENLEDERADLEEATDQLCAIASQFEVTEGEELVERRFPDLQARWRRLDGLQTECETVMDRRQEQLHQRPSVCLSHDRSPVAMSSYLFNDLEVDFPVLAAGTSLLERIEAEQRHTVEALTERRR